MFDRVLNTLLHVFLHISRTSLQWDLLLLTGVQKQPPEVLFKKAVLKNFFKFTGKNLCQSFFFNKVAGPATLIKRRSGKGVFP